jgi:hypothetical protein
LVHEPIRVLPSFPAHILFAEFVLGNLSLSEVNADTQRQIRVAPMHQRRIANGERSCKALLRVGEEAQQRAVLSHHRYKIVSSDACRGIKEQVMEIVR